MIVNSLYHSGVIGGLIVGNTMLMKKVLKMNPPNLGKLDLEDIGKLSLSVLSATMIRDWLVKQGIIPEDISPGQ